MNVFLEMLMVLAFGFAWPTSIIKSYKARTAKGKSLSFLVIINIGYLCGIASKFMLISDNGFDISKHYVLFFYIINFIMVSVDFALYFRNKKLDKLKEN